MIVAVGCLLIGFAGFAAGWFSCRRHASGHLEVQIRGDSADVVVFDWAVERRERGAA